MSADTIRDALEASRHIAECGEHPDHLLDAENKARAALAALDELEAELERLTVGRATLEDQTNRAELAEAQVDEARDHLARLNRCIVEHHGMHNLSDDAIRESVGGPCQICIRAAVLSGGSE